MTSAKKAWLPLLVMAVLFAMAFAVNYFTPMHSDDFVYKLKGISWTAIWAHYNNWSGRILADTISSGLLNLNIKWLEAAANTAALCLLCYLLTAPLRKIGNSALTALGYFTIFALYWISNPSLGQTTFWLVGAANYLWTNLFIISYILLTIRHLEQKPTNGQWALYLAVSFFAGMTNENTSATVFLLTLFFIFDQFRKNKTLNIALITSMIPLGIGAAILILSPGNSSRASHPNFADWYASPIYERIAYQLANRMPVGLSKYIPLYIFMGFLLIVARKYKLSKNAKAIATAKILFIFSIIANLIFVAAPSVPHRALNGAFCLTLLSAAFLISSFEVKYAKRMLAAFLLVLLPYFATSYVLIVKAYHSASLQDLIRISLIKEAKARGETVISVPDYYFTRLLTRRDKFDLHHASNKVGEYYGLSEVTVYDATFDYSALREPLPERHPLGAKGLSQLIVGNRSFYVSKDKEVLSDKDHLATGLNTDLKEKIISRPMKLRSEYVVEVKE